MKGLVCSQLALFWYSFNPLFCEWARLNIRAFAGKFSFFFSLSGDPTVWVAHFTLASSDCPQAFRLSPYFKH